eukprot:jgi/Botrbrau1/6493/Bobra.0034s0066.1
MHSLCVTLSFQSADVNTVFTCPLAAEQNALRKIVFYVATGHITTTWGFRQGHRTTTSGIPPGAGKGREGVTHLCV